MLPNRNSKPAQPANNAAANSASSVNGDRISNQNSIMHELKAKLSVRFADKIEIDFNSEKNCSSITKNPTASLGIIKRSTKGISPPPANVIHSNNSEPREYIRHPTPFPEGMENRQRNFLSHDRNRSPAPNKFTDPPRPPTPGHGHAFPSLTHSGLNPVTRNFHNSEQNAPSTSYSGSNYRISYPPLEQRDIYVERSQTPNPAFMDSNYSRRCHTPSGSNDYHRFQGHAENNDRRPMSGSRQTFSDAARSYDEYHLPAIDLKCAQNQETRPVTSRPSSVVLPNIDNSSNKSVLEVVKIFEQNTLRQPQMSQNREISRRAGSSHTEGRKFDTANEDSIRIHPGDDCPTRIGKIRRTLQRFDRDAVPYERCTTIDGKSEAEDAISGARSSSLHTFQSMREEENIQNKEIDRTSLIRVTRFRANKPTKKPSTTKTGPSRIMADSNLRYSREELSPPMEIVDDYIEPDESGVIQKPDWVIRSVEAGSPVQSSVRDTWDSVNYQMRVKLKGNYYDESNVNEHTPME